MRKYRFATGCAKHGSNPMRDGGGTQGRKARNRWIFVYHQIHGKCGSFIKVIAISRRRKRNVLREFTPAIMIIIEKHAERSYYLPS